MFSKIKTDRYTPNLSERIDLAAKALTKADAILIGAGAGFSAAAGLKYSGLEFLREFADYIKKYHFHDLYSSSFYDFKTEEERWARWARHIDFIRFRPGAMPLYLELLELVNHKNYFVITTNVDVQFRKAGFDNDRIFEVQGDYGLMQCARACHHTLYDDRRTVEDINANAHDLTVDSRFVPHCPMCGGKMDVHVRVNGIFIEDAHWHSMAERYYSFVEKYKSSRLVLLELGVGFNTPTIIRYPFEQITYADQDATLIRLNSDYPQCFPEIQRQTISFSEEMSSVIAKIKQSEDHLLPPTPRFG